MYTFDEKLALSHQEPLTRLAMTKTYFNQDPKLFKEDYNEALMRSAERSHQLSRGAGQKGLVMRLLSILFKL